MNRNNFINLTKTLVLSNKNDSKTQENRISLLRYFDVPFPFVAAKKWSDICPIFSVKEKNEKEKKRKAGRRIKTKSRRIFLKIFKKNWKKNFSAS